MKSDAEFRRESRTCDHFVGGDARERGETVRGAGGGFSALPQARRLTTRRAQDQQCPRPGPDREKAWASGHHQPRTARENMAWTTAMLRAAGIRLSSLHGRVAGAAGVSHTVFPHACWVRGGGIGRCRAAAGRSRDAINEAIPRGVPIPHHALHPRLGLGTAPVSDGGP